MRKITKAVAIGVVVAAAGGIGLVAMAETSGPGPGPGFMNGHMGPGTMMGMGGPQGHGFGDPSGHLAALKAEIGIRLEQEPAWDAYAKVVQDTATEMRASHANMDPDAMHGTSPRDHSAFMTTRWAQHEQAFGKVKTAAEALLASLDDAQKAKARTTLPGLVSHDFATMRPNGMPMMRHGTGTIPGPAPR